jgi:hypothetical protein
VAQRDRFVDQDTAEALKRQQGEFRPFWRDYSRPVRVFFPAANVTRQVAHGLGTVPDGFLVVLSTVGRVIGVTPELWTNDLALLSGNLANTRAVLIFFTLREEPIDV